jgi:multidrug efflux system membrane fusion protein
MSNPRDFDAASATTAGAPNERRWRLVWPERRTLLWIVGGLVVLALVIWRAIPDASTDRSGRLGGAQSVAVARAVQGDLDITLNALGTVTPLATVTVRPQVGGQIVKIYFTEGQMVKAGTLLVEIDPRPFQAALDQAKGQLARDQASLANAILDLKRQKGLMAANATSQQAYATQQAQVGQLQGTVKSDEANVQAAAINLGFARVTSPVDGRVGLRQVDLGNTVSAGQTNGIVVVTQEEPISVLFTLPEDNVSDILEKVNAGAKLTVQAFDRGQTKLIATGTLATVDNQIDTTTGTVKLRAMFDNAKGELFPNQFVNVRLKLDTLHGQTLIPIAAVQRGSDGTYVFVVTPEKEAQIRNVTLGPSDATRVSIVKGLQPGDTVVVDGADRLRDGTKVEIPNVKTPIAAPSGGAAGGEDAHAARRAKMAAILKQYCAADFAKYCPNAKPGTQDARMCMRENRDSFSDACRNALKKLRSSSGGGGSGGGGGGGP